MEKVEEGKWAREKREKRERVGLRPDRKVSSLFWVEADDLTALGQSEQEGARQRCLSILTEENTLGVHCEYTVYGVHGVHCIL